MTSSDRLSSLYRTLIGCPTVSGCESLHTPALSDIVLGGTDGFFGESRVLPSGGLLFTHKGTGHDHILLDAHIDTVGFAVEAILPGGFLRLVPVGGIDVRILPAKEILIYGKKTIRGVFVSTPPHLTKDGKDACKKPDDEDSALPLVDTGYDNIDALKEIIRVGTPCGFGDTPVKMPHDTLCGPGMDDKICAAAAIDACRRLAGTGCCSVSLLLSAGEETSGVGVRFVGNLAPYPSAAVVLDVNYATMRGIPAHQSLRIGEGGGVSYSVTTSRPLTQLLYDTAKKCAIPVQSVVETSSTGTNATSIALAGQGIPTAVLSIPEGYMHTYNETVSLADVSAVSDLLRAFVLAFPEGGPRAPLSYINHEQEGASRG